MIRAKLPGEFEPSIVDVGNEYGRGAGLPRGLQR